MLLYVHMCLNCTPTSLVVTQCVTTARPTRVYVQAMIITGSGSFFSSGADVSGASALPDEFNSAEAPVGQFMLTLMAITKPVIAAVNGPASKLLHQPLYVSRIVIHKSLL